MGTPTQPAKKQRSIPPYLSTYTGKRDMFILLVGIGLIFWLPVEMLFFGEPMNVPLLALASGWGIVIVALCISFFRQNRTIKR